MYRPESKIIRHGLADVKFTRPDMDYDGWKSIADDYVANQKAKYRETNDVYDLQSEEVRALDNALVNTKGKDYQYLQESIVAERNNIKELFKGKRLRDTKTPEFQTELYNIKQRLAAKRNSIDTFYGEADQATKIAMNTPSIKKKEWQDYLNAQLQLPPDQRDVNLVNKINTDPLFFNPYDYTSSVLSSRGKQDQQIERESDYMILNYDVTYRPDLGYFDKNNNYVAAPSDSVVDDLLQKDRRFYNAMAGMLPPEQANALLGQGNTGAFDKAVRDQARKYVATVKGFDPEYKQTGKTLNPKYYNRETVADKKKVEEEQSILALQQRLQAGDIRALKDFEGDHWTGFEYSFGENGNVTIKANYTDKDAPSYMKLMGKDKKVQVIEIDANDPESVRQAYNIIKYFANKDKKQVNIKKPLGKPVKNTGWADEIE